MAGKRLKDPSLTRTTYPEAIANNGEILTDWDGLVWARPIPLKLVGNSWWQGSYDGVSWENFIKDDHIWARVSTDGGITWLVFKMSCCSGTGETHPPLTLGSPSGGLALDESNQILTLNPASATEPGSMSATHFIKLEALKFDYLENIGTEYEIYSSYYDSGNTRYHEIRTLSAGTGVTLNYIDYNNSIEISTVPVAGTYSLGRNVGTDGVGVFDANNSPYIDFRHVASLHTGLTIELDAYENDIDFDLVESNIDHDLLKNFVTNEHIDHSAVSILTQEGITGGGDLTATRTLTLAFDELTLVTEPEDSDILAIYRDESSEDLHYGISYADLVEGVTEVHNTYYVPLTTGVYTTTGLTGGGILNIDRTISLAFNDLPTVVYDSLDYLPIYDVSGGVHAKVLLSDIVGELAVSITAGDGMDFTTITSTGSVDMGTPTTLTKTTTDLASGTTHEHEVDLSTWDLIDIGDVDGTPVSGEYLKWDGSNWVTDDPAIGATVPGEPVYSIQFNDNGSFGGNADLTYIPSENKIYFQDVNIPEPGIIFGESVSAAPSIIQSDNVTTGQRLTLQATSTAYDFLELYASRIALAEADSASSNSYLFIQDPNTTQYVNALEVQNLASAKLMIVTATGEWYAPQLDPETEDNILYYDPVDGRITYGAAPSGTGGGITTLIADSLSGLMVNGGSTSSAATIELDQNDLKLPSATPVVSDYIGFYDQTTDLQSKTQIGSLPGWKVSANSISEEIGPGDTLTFVEGSGIDLSYSTATNELTITSTGGSGGCIQAVAALGTISNGGTANLDLNSYAGGTMTMSGSTATLQFNNVQEGDTGHVEVNHTTGTSLTISVSGATVIIANNSHYSGDAVALTPTGGTDTVCFWMAKGNFHVAVIYDLS